MLIVTFNAKNRIAIIVVIILLLFLQGNLYPQQVSQPSRQASYNYFNKGDYESAYREFSNLLQNYPKDPLYKYYCGVCLVKTGRDPVKATDLLKASLSNQVEIRSVPQDAWFYLGRSQQLSGKFMDAIKSYNIFEQNSGRKAAKDMKVQEYIQECHEGRGMSKDQVYGDLIEKAVSDTNLREKPSDKASGAEVRVVSAVPVAETKRKIVPAGYDKSLTEAMDFQVKADSLNAIASGYKQEYSRVPAGQKQAALARIQETEAMAAKYQKLADAKFGRSDTGRIARSNVDTIVIGKMLKVEGVQDSGRKAEGKKPDVMGPLPQQTEPPTNTADIFSIFAVTPDQSLLKDLKIEIDPRLPSGLIYRIQIGVFTKPLALNYFKGVVPVSGFKIPSTVSTRYFAGLFRRNTDAGKALLKVRQAGFRDAFVVAAFDGKPVSLERASMLEKEWGNKPLVTVQVASENKSGSNVAPTLIFRVEIARTLIPVSDDTLEVFRNLAGSKGFTTLMSADGSFVYLIGKFITFESATEYAGLLNRNGYEHARVVAYMGNMEIPVEKAKQLFEKVE